MITEALGQNYVFGVGQSPDFDWADFKLTEEEENPCVHRCGFSSYDQIYVEEDTLFTLCGTLSRGKHRG